MEFLQEVVHDATQTLLDQHPSLFRFAMQPKPWSGLRKSSYFKLDVNELLGESTLATLKCVWCEEMVKNQDPCVKWG